MTDPLTVHAEALADLDRQIEALRRAVGPMAGQLVGAAEGRKRILQRHEPLECVNVLCPETHWCGGCDPDGDEECWMVRWPCPDWLDAAALLPEVEASGSNVGGRDDG